MTLETFNQEIIALSSTIASASGAVPDVAITNEEIGKTFKSSPSLDFIYPTWCKYILGYDLLSSSEGKISDGDTLVRLLRDISSGIEDTISGRELDRAWMVENEKSRIITERRANFIASLSGEITFVEWADYNVDDPFMNVAMPEWIPGDEFWGIDSEMSGVSGTSGTSGLSGYGEQVQDNSVSEISEERKEEIREIWGQLGIVDTSDIHVEFPEYVDFSEDYSNSYVIPNQDDVVVSILQDTAFAEVFRDRDHSDVWAAISKVIRTLDAYSQGTPAERGKAHSNALKGVIVRALPVAINEQITPQLNCRDYKFSGPDDPVFTTIRDGFKDLIDMEYVSPKRFNFSTTITVDGGKVTTTENFSLFDL